MMSILFELRHAKLRVYFQTKIIKGSKISILRTERKGSGRLEAHNAFQLTLSDRGEHGL